MNYLEEQRQAVKEAYPDLDMPAFMAALETAVNGALLEASKSLTTYSSALRTLFNRESWHPDPFNDTDSHILDYAGDLIAAADTDCWFAKRYAECSECGKVVKLAEAVDLHWDFGEKGDYCPSCIEDRKLLGVSE